MVQYQCYRLRAKTRALPYLVVYVLPRHKPGILAQLPAHIPIHLVYHVVAHNRARPAIFAVKPCHINNISYICNAQFN